MCRLLDLIKYWLPGLMAGSFLFAVVCAKARDPNKRIEFSLKTATGGHVKGIAILPKPPAKHAVVIYAHGAGGSMLSSGKVLRQIAEVGLAAVAIEYDQTDQSVFDEQFIALISYINQQPWAQTNAVGWVGFSLGAQRMLRFALTHFEYQPQLMVR